MLLWMLPETFQLPVDVKLGSTMQSGFQGRILAQVLAEDLMLLRHIAD